MLLWKDAKRAQAQELIDWLISVHSNGGWPIDLVNMVAFAELGSSSTNSALTYSRILDALAEISKTNKNSVEEFEAVFDKQLKSASLAAKTQVKRWQFFIPIEVKLANDMPPRVQIKVHGKTLYVIRREAVGRRLDAKSREALRNPMHIQVLTGQKTERVPAIFLSVSARGSSWNVAWNDIAPAFDAFRGLVELTLDFYGWRHGGGGKSARRKIPGPRWMIARASSATAEWMHFVTEEEGGNGTDPFNLTLEAYAVIKKNAVLLRKEPAPQSTLALIADCFRLYSQAMDARFQHLCLLGFWQLAEAITHSETVGGNTDKVVARLAWHGIGIGLKASGYRETLAVLGRKRNDIVHRGIHDVQDDDINILKFACEVAIEWLIRIQKTLPSTAHIEHYYRLRDMNNTDLEAVRDCVAYLKKDKG